MHIIIKKNYLLEALNIVNKAVANKSAIPILTGIKFTTTNKSLQLIASDTDISIQYDIPITMEEKEVIEIKHTGSIVLSAKYIIDIIRKIPGENVEIKTEENFNTVIKASKVEFSIIGLDASEFPQLPYTIEENNITIPSSLFKMLIKNTYFAVYPNENRPNLTGIQWQILQQEDEVFLRFNATDSHRLAQNETKVILNNNFNLNSLIVPGKSLSELLKILPDTNESIDIAINEQQIIIKSNNLMFYSRLINGTFPDISKIIPQNSKTTYRFNTSSLIEAIDRALLLVKDEKNNIVKFTSIDEQNIEISSNTSEIGRVVNQVEALEFIGEPIKLAFNGRYMLEALKTIDTSEVIINFTGPTSSFLIYPSDHKNLLHLLLPMRI